ncbi:hypothetical protein [Streptomyces violascens]
MFAGLALTVLATIATYVDCAFEHGLVGMRRALTDGHRAAPI